MHSFRTRENICIYAIWFYLLTTLLRWTIYLSYFNISIICIPSSYIPPQHTEILIWRHLIRAKFCDIWAMSVCPSVVNTTAYEREELRTWNFAHLLLLPILWLVKWIISVRRIWYLPYKPNRYTGVLGTSKVRLTPNLIFWIVY